MSVVSAAQVENILNEIRGLSNQLVGQLSDIEEKCLIIRTMNSELSSYNGAIVEGSYSYRPLGQGPSVIAQNGNKIIEEYQKFAIQGTSGIESSITAVQQEVANLEDALTESNQQTVLMSSTLEIIAIYLSRVENILSDETSFINKLKFANDMMRTDAESGYYILHSTGIMENGEITIPLSKDGYKYNGNYLRFYNENGIKFYAPLAKFIKDEKGNIITTTWAEDGLHDFSELAGQYYANIMRNSSRYTQKFKDYTNSQLDTVYLADMDYDKSWQAFTAGYSGGVKKASITVDLHNVSSSNEGYTYTLDAYTHELGHVYDNAVLAKEYPNASKSVYGVSQNWTFNKIYRDIRTNDPNYETLREYAHSTPTECFAEAVTEYFGSSNPDFDTAMYNSVDLKKTKIDMDGYDNLYDYMDDVLNY